MTIVEKVTVRVEEEEDEEGKVKMFPFSKQKGVILESENKFFFERKERDPKLLEEEVEWLFFRGTISFSEGRTKVGGLNLIMVGTFSGGINSCFLI